jgi:hypothetical protein
LAVVREIDRQNSSITYRRWKSIIASQYGKDVADKHCVHENWTHEQCMDFICEKLGSNHKLVKILETNQQK